MIDNIRYYSLKQYTFVDTNDIEPGSIEDLVLSPDTLEPTHLILGAGFFEEFMEDIGNKENIDEIAELSKMEMKHDIVYLNEQLEDLIRTNKDGSLPFDGILFSHIREFEIYDNNIMHDAEIHDLLIAKPSALIIQSQNLQKEMKLKGYKQKLEMIIPLTKVKFDEKNNIIRVLFDLDDIIAKIEQEIEPRYSGKSLIQL